MGFPDDSEKNAAPAPLYKQPMQGVKILGGYVIKTVGNLPLPGATLTTFDHKSFTIEIELEELSLDPDSVKVDTDYNMMTVSIPMHETSHKRVRILQIGIPNGKNEDFITVGNPLEHGGKLVIEGR